MICAHHSPSLFIEDGESSVPGHTVNHHSARFCSSGNHSFTIVTTSGLTHSRSPKSYPRACSTQAASSAAPASTASCRITTASTSRTASLKAFAFTDTETPPLTAATIYSSFPPLLLAGLRQLRERATALRHGVF